MDLSNLRGVVPLCGVIVVLVWTIPSGAAPISSYSVVNLGTNAPGLQTGVDGSSVAVGSDGTTYAFPRSSTSGWSALGALTPPPYSASWSSPDAWAHWTGAVINKNGDLVATEDRGVGREYDESVVLLAQRQADGSYGPFHTLWSSAYTDRSDLNMLNGLTLPLARVIDVNQLNQLLGTGFNSAPYFPYMNGIYDVKSGTFSLFAELLPNWNITSAIALDDAGRVLIQAYGKDYPNSQEKYTLLLLPPGVSAEQTVPEASTLATLLTAIVGVGWSRLRRSARPDPVALPH